MEMSSETKQLTKSQIYYAKNKDALRVKRLERYYVRTYDERGLPRPKKILAKTAPTTDELTQMKIERMKMMAHIIWLSYLYGNTKPME